MTPLLAVVAPHPDDETLGVAGPIVAARARGETVRIIIMTDGEAQRDPPVPPSIDGHEPGRSRALAERRRAEARAAVSELGVPATEVHFLGLPDQGLFPLCFAPPHVSPWSGQVFAAGAGETELTELLRPATRVVVTHPADRHRDHLAAACIVDDVLRTAGSRAVLECYLIHARAPEQGAPAVPLAPDVAMCKQRALAAYVSQATAYAELFATSTLAEAPLVPPPPPLVVGASPQQVAPHGGLGPRLEVQRNVRGGLALRQVDGPRAEFFARGVGKLGEGAFELAPATSHLVAAAWVDQTGANWRGGYPRFITVPDAP